MGPVADDFAAIARRLKEIQAEVAKERATADGRRHPDDTEPQPQPLDWYNDIAACA